MFSLFYERLVFVNKTKQKNILKKIIKLILKQSKQYKQLFLNHINILTKYFQSEFSSHLIRYHTTGAYKNTNLSFQE